MNWPVLLIFVPLLTACGPGSQKTFSNYKSEEPQEEIRPQMEGQYLGILNPVNEAVTGNIRGAVTLSKDNDELVADVSYSGGPLGASILHAQSVHVGNRCPHLDDDTNRDGHIDAKEGEAVYGKVLIRLDEDLNLQHLGVGIYPLADQFGGYIYARVASFSRFITDLYEEDINPNDYLIKLIGSECLQLENKVVVVQGVAPSANLPTTVSSNNRLANHQTFPVACAELVKVLIPPGEIQEDEAIDPDEATPGGPNGHDDGTVIVPPEMT